MRMVKQLVYGRCCHLARLIVPAGFLAGAGLLVLARLCRLLLGSAKASLDLHIDSYRLDCFRI